MRSRLRRGRGLDVKMVRYDGVAAVTDDDLADALLDLAITLAKFSRYEHVTLPVLVDSAQQQLTIMLGPTIHMSAISIGSSAAAGVEGAQEAIDRIRLRIRALDDPLHALDRPRTAALGEG